MYWGSVIFSYHNLTIYLFHYTFVIFISLFFIFVYLSILQMFMLYIVQSTTQTLFKIHVLIFSAPCLSIFHTL